MNDIRKTHPTIYWIGGSKGGVGKSMVTMAVLDLLLEGERRPLLVECDTSNPDVCKAYDRLATTELIDLDQADGWIHLVNTCETQRGGTVVVNTAARNNAGVRQYGQTLEGSLEELGSELVVLWVINRQRDSLELLKEFMDAVPRARIHVVRNAYFGDERKFEVYQGSKVRESVESRGGLSVTFPELADRVADDLFCKRLAIEAAAKVLPIGNRAELARWRGGVRRVLQRVVG